MPDAPESDVHAAALVVVIREQVVADQGKVDRAGIGPVLGVMQLVALGRGFA